MKFLSFNINGLRARLHQLDAIIRTLDPEIIGLQETKVHDNMFPVKEISRYGYHSYYHGQKGHYGVALLSKKKPLAIYRGLNTDTSEAQCRIIIGKFFTKQGILTVLNGYFPQGENRNHPIKFPAKERFYIDVQEYIEHYYQNDSLLVIMGDMNICPNDIDIGISKESRKRWIRTGKCAFLAEERVWIHRLLSWGLIDTYRHVNPDKNNCYSWFDYRSRGFYKNSGLRIDLLLASKPMIKLIRKSGIDYNIRAMDKPSDHAPVWTNFEL
ncbi:exodeoxyribonuclease III [secondary endosymbiont of Heteropsylla cubana]|uniref:Exodeoxyribonuclease III n=1 Tax=secondary endosymbiont of Heteropsylla cubana TaxID=134287 RepID=J3YTE9_9ENTR|nr:exodeoxyribonuclease III [secondary endosymbiont of Heteropsylla cubana]AFP85728.1 exodeoxyribonuclease III [secondary endosymbiont of Heteropsylla cubana]